MKKYTIMPILMLVAMTVQLHAAHILTAARAFSKMPVARMYQTAGRAGFESEEPVGNEWNKYVRTSWRKVPAGVYYDEHVEKKIRILNALIRNKKSMIPPVQFDYQEGVDRDTKLGAKYGAVVGTVAGLYFSMFGADFAQAVALSLGCGGIGGVMFAVAAGAAGIPINYICAKLETYENRKAYADSLQKVRNLYTAYLESPEEVSRLYNAGLIESVEDELVREPLPTVILKDLYEESKRAGRIQE